MTNELSRPLIDLPTGIDAAAPGKPQWGSDVIADVLRLLDVEYAAVNPGSSFRGLHDSLVNYNGNRRPEMILVNHEMIAVSIARGYARATGRPMAAILHDHVGLLNAGMTIYDAWVDRSPVIVLGGTGPVDAAQRRPWIDWIHTANEQGAAVRDFTKWDDQPASVEAIPESLLRAYRIAVTEPCGPVYVCFDATLQEQQLAEGFKLPDPARFRPSAATQPDRAALRAAARWLVEGELPVVFADGVGRNAEAVKRLVELAELLAIPVIDGGLRQSFPMPHALDFAGAEASLLRDADVILGLDMVDLDGALRGVPNREGRNGPRVISISMDEYAHRGASTDYQALPAVDLPMLGETNLALPELLEECRSLLTASSRDVVTRRRAALEARQSTLRAEQRAFVQSQWDHPEITETRLAAEMWNAIRSDEFVLAYGKFRSLAPGVFEVGGPEQSLGWGVGGGAVGAAPGVAVGVALAHRDTGRLPVAMLGDGEFLASIQVLWTAAHYQLPGLLVINNNRSYFNDEAHQDRIARIRGRAVENRWIGQRLENPVVDFATIARSFDLFAVGPVKTAADLPKALMRAVAAARRGQMAVVDVWTENRPATSGRERPRP